MIEGSAIMHLRHVAYKALSSAPSIYLTDIVARRMYGGKIPNRGRTIDTNDAAISPWVRTLVFWDMYETAELRLIQRYLPENMDVLELGGSIGVVSSHIAGSLEAGRRLVSVEANPQLIKLLKRNIESNGSPEGAIVVHGAVAYALPPADLIGMSFGESSLDGSVGGSKEKRPECLVPCFTLRELVARYKFGRFVLISDIEGAEAGIFIEDREALARCPLMIVELHETTFQGRDLSVQELVAMVVELGYTARDNHRNVYVFARTL
jgi:FkbM family methyltransferase